MRIMNMTNILVIVGGISKGSLNQKLFRAFRDLAAKEYLMESFDISQLPFFSQDLEEDLPSIVRDFKTKIEASSAILFITPEYNRSFPGVIKNAIDWGSRPYGKNSWNKKTAGLIGASIGSIGTFGAQNHLRQVLNCLDLQIMNQPEFYLNGSKAFDENGKLNDPKIQSFIEKYWVSYSEWINKHALI